MCTCIYIFFRFCSHLELLNKTRLLVTLVTSPVLCLIKVSDVFKEIHGLGLMLQERMKDNQG